MKSIWKWWTKWWGVVDHVVAKTSSSSSFSSSILRSVLTRVKGYDPFTFLTLVEYTHTIFIPSFDTVPFTKLHIPISIFYPLLPCHATNLVILLTAQFIFFSSFVQVHLQENYFHWSKFIYKRILATHLIFSSFVSQDTHEKFSYSRTRKRVVLYLISSTLVCVAAIRAVRSSSWVKNIWLYRHVSLQYYVFNFFLLVTYLFIFFSS